MKLYIIYNTITDKVVAVGFRTEESAMFFIKNYHNKNEAQFMEVREV